MKPGRLLLLPVAISALGTGSLVQAQPADELDMTITVMEPGETPSGLVNRIELPPVDALSASETAVQQEMALDVLPEDEVSDDAAALADDASDVATDAVRETLSIDGLPDPDAPGDDRIPAPVVDVLDSEVPLPARSGDVLDSVDDIVDSDNVPDEVDDVVDTVDDTTDTVDETTDAVDDVVDDATGDTGDVTDDIVDNIDDTAGDADDVVDDVVDDTGGVTTEEMVADDLATDDLEPSPSVDDIESDTLDDSVDDVSDDLPDL